MSKPTKKQLQQVERAMGEALERAIRGVEDYDPADNEAVFDRIDPSKGFVEGNVCWISGLAYKMPYHQSMSLDEIRPKFPKKDVLAADNPPTGAVN
jgi:hypothetical protein